METALIIPIYERAEYLRQCFDSIMKVHYPQDSCVILIDDGSTDPETISLINEFSILDVIIIRHRNIVNKGIKFVLRKTIDMAFNMGCKTVINLDSDTLVKPNFILRLLELHEQFPDNIVTGFNCITKNKDGSYRHPIILEHEGYCLKKYVGGINMCFNQEVYKKYILPAFDTPNNWDHTACISSSKDNKPIVCAVPSCVQHIGLQSSLGHNHDMPDIACDFYCLSLLDVTLFGIDHKNAKMLLRAAEISTRDIEFGAVKMITDNVVDGREQYSQFCIKSMNEYIETSHVLIIHPDGYVLNWKAWNNDWLQYDYIGATWGYKDNKNVGNGGFSLRSKKLLDILATDDAINDFHPEDDKICRKYRPYLEEKYGIKFAPEEVANVFSIEAYGVGFEGAKRYNGQFGFHSVHVDFSQSDLPKELLLPTPVQVSIRPQITQPIRQITKSYSLPANAKRR